MYRFWWIMTDGCSSIHYAPHRSPFILHWLNIVKTAKNVVNVKISSPHTHYEFSSLNIKLYKHHNSLTFVQRVDDEKYYFWNWFAFNLSWKKTIRKLLFFFVPKYLTFQFCNNNLCRHYLLLCLFFHRILALKFAATDLSISNLSQ